jgi:hypothetical protein
MALSYGSKGKGPVSCGYASGGPSITTNSRFLKVPDTFRTSLQKQDYDKVGKGGTLSKMSGESKSEKAIKPKT